MLEQAQGAPIRCWLQIDTGMHRLGFAPEATRGAHARLRAARGVTGAIVLMSHFPSSDEFAGVSYDRRQHREQLPVFAGATGGRPGQTGSAPVQQRGDRYVSDQEVSVS